MDAKELREIKLHLLQARWEIRLPDYLWNEIQELITALEAAQAELAQAEKWANFNLAEFKKMSQTVIDLRKQLAESKAYADKLAQGLPCLPKDIEILHQANANFAQENEELKAEVEHLKSTLEMVSGTRISDPR